MTRPFVEETLPDMPELPPPAYPTHVDDVTADRLARYFTATAAGQARRMFGHRWFTYGVKELATAEYQAARDDWMTILRDFVGNYQAAFLLRALIAANPDAADEAACGLWCALDDGETPHESVDVWLTEYGITLPDEQPATS